MSLAKTLLNKYTATARNKFGNMNSQQWNDGAMNKIKITDGS